MTKSILLGSVLAVLVSPTVSFAEKVQYLGQECVINPSSAQSVSYGIDGLNVNGSGYKYIKCPAWTQTHTSATISMPNMLSYGNYVKAKNISSARMCVVRKHYNGIPGNTLPSFVCGTTDTTGNSTFTYTLNLPTGTAFSSFDQPIAYLSAKPNQNPNVRFYGFRYQ